MTTPHHRKLPSWFTLAALLLGSALAACSATLGDDQDGAGGSGTLGEDAIPTETNACTSPEESLEREVYVPIFSKCIGCHNEYGLAVNQGSDFILEFPENSSFSSHNVETLTRVAKRTVDQNGEQLSVLLAKPTGAVGHIGGQVLDPDGNHAQLLQSFIDKLLDPPDCEAPEDSADEALATLQLASYRETYARAARILTGKPVDEEAFAKMEDSEAGLDAALTGLMERQDFRKRLAAFYGDALLAMANGPINVNNDILDRGGWPSNNYFEPDCGGKLTNVCCSVDREACCFAEEDPTFCAAGKKHTQTAIAYEPLAFIEKVTEQDLPVTEILTRGDAILNPYTAAISGFTPGDRAALFDDNPDNDAEEWKFAKIPANDRNKLEAAFGETTYPHAGILSTSSMLSKYYSTKSNLHRTRAARLIFEHMLDIDVKTFADFSTNVLPADADLERATVDYPACLACHAAIDPVARHFENHVNYGFFRPDKAKTPEHFPPASYLGEQAPGGANPVAWLGKRVAEDQRFPLGMLKPVLVGLLGIEFLAPPQRVEDPEYTIRWEAYRIQQALVRETLAGLPSGALTFKDLVRAAVKSRFFRASGSTGDKEQRDVLRFAGVGGGVLITPELFESHALELLPHGAVDVPGAKGDGITSQRGFRYLLGGVNWLSVEERARIVSPVAVRTTERIANELACEGVPGDFSYVERTDRRLFKNVEWDWTPADHEAEFRKELSRFFLLFHAKDVSADDPRVDDALDLWKKAHAEGQKHLENGGNSAKYVDCSSKSEEPGRRVVSEDPDYVIRAWVITVSYFLSSPDFILE